MSGAGREGVTYNITVNAGSDKAADLDRLNARLNAPYRVKTRDTETAFTIAAARERRRALADVHDGQGDRRADHHHQRSAADQLKTHSLRVAFGHNAGHLAQGILVLGCVGGFILHAVVRHFDAHHSLLTSARVAARHVTGAILAALGALQRKAWTRRSAHTARPSGTTRGGAQ